MTATPLPIVKVTVRSVTYLGRRAQVTTTHHDRKRDGLRSIVTTWIDAATVENGGHPAGTVTHTLVEGDGRRPSFIIHEAERVVA